MKIEFSAEADEDLAAAAAYLVDRNFPAALNLVDGVLTTIARLADAEFEGPEFTLRSGRRVRGWPVPPYRVFYQRAADVLFVVRIHDQRRRPITR